MTFKLELDSMTQTIFYETDVSLSDEEQDELVDFCIDTKFQVRKGSGIVNTMSDDEYEFHPGYVPSERWDIEHSPWNSHSNYVTIELPCDPEKQTLVREAFMGELNRRLEYLVVQAKERIAREESDDE